MLASWEEQRDRKLLQKLVTSFRFTSILLPSSSSGTKKLSLWFQICDDFGRVINPQVAAVPSPKETKNRQHVEDDQDVHDDARVLRHAHQAEADDEVAGKSLGLHAGRQAEVASSQTVQVTRHKPAGKTKIR